MKEWETFYIRNDHGVVRIMRIAQLAKYGEQPYLALLMSSSSSLIRGEIFQDPSPVPLVHLLGDEVKDLARSIWLRENLYHLAPPHLLDKPL